jgi:uncharacterized protein (DUF2267 family)
MILPEIRSLLKTLVDSAQTVLGRNLAGLYLHGSLASGDFNLRTSDIDFAAVTTQAVSAAEFRQLQEMHARLYASGLPWSQKLEGAYLPPEVLRRHDPAHPPVPWLGVDGHFALETLGSDWIFERWMLREHGVVLHGPALREWIDPVTAEDLKAAVRASLREWWSPPFPSPQRFESDEYRAYAVLTMCRSLFVLANGRPASKPEAARWALIQMDEHWHDLIHEALVWSPGKAFNFIDRTFELMEYTLAINEPNRQTDPPDEQRYFR